MHRLVKAAGEPAEEDDGVLLREVVLVEGARVTVAEPAYLDMAFGLLVVDKRADALHEVRRVLVAVAHYAHAARRVVRADVVAEGVEVALDEVRGVPVRARGWDSEVRGGGGAAGGTDSQMAKVLAVVVAQEVVEAVGTAVSAGVPSGGVPDAVEECEGEGLVEDDEGVAGLAEGVEEGYLPGRDRVQCRARGHGFAETEGG